MGGRLVKRAMFFVLFVALVAAGAFAGTGQAFMGVKATYTATASVSTTDIDFGDFYAGETDISRTATVTVTATGSVGYILSLDGGTHQVGGVRYVQNAAGPAYKVPYALLESGAPWGDNYNTALGYTRAGAGSGSWTVTGILQNLSSIGTGWPTGTYDDLVTITITY